MGTRSRQTIQLVTLSTLVLCAPAGAQQVYWGDHGGVIRRAYLDGSEIQVLISGLGDPMGIALDLDAGTVYWADWFTQQIQRANLDGSAAQTVLSTGSLRPKGVALDVERGKIYWSAGGSGSGTGVLQRANLDGTDIENLVTNLDSIQEIALDWAGERIYWTEYSSGVGRVRRANLDGSNIEDIIVDSTILDSIALDLLHGKLYWTNTYPWPGKIHRANLDGGNVETILVEKSAPSAIALDPATGKMYWGVDENVSAILRRANLDGSQVENLIAAVPEHYLHPYGLALDLRCLSIGQDCQPNGRVDLCDIRLGVSPDCNENETPDECDLAGGLESDCNTNGVPDSCESNEDCNENGSPDICDLANGTSADCNSNHVPDECETNADCNQNGIQDICDIAAATSKDCDQDGVPDECEIDCNFNGINDVCEAECNGNGVPDDCDIANATSSDCDSNGIPDECDLDCNGNTIPDTCDILAGTSSDADGSGIPDECELYAGCVIDPDRYDYRPHRTNLEAEQLAMKLTGQLRAPNDEYYRILRDLHLIRLALPETATVVGHGDYQPMQLLVRVAEGPSASAYDALNAYYQMVDDPNLGGVHLLTFCDSVNAPVLAGFYTALPEVVYAEPNWYLGDGDRVTVTREVEVYTYAISERWGDCLSGCTCSIDWVVQVDDEGKVVLLSRTESGGCRCGLCDDCNNNLVDDACDIGCGAPLSHCDVYGCGGSADRTGNGIPDECEAPPQVIPESVAVKTRAISFSAPPPAVATGVAGQTAIRVTMIDLQNPVPPNLPTSPPPNFSAFESATCTAVGEANCCARWVGKPGTFLESQDTPGIGNFKAARVQCTPYYHDWGSEGLLHVVGAEVLPSSSYKVEVFAASCMGNEAACLDVSAPVTIGTRRLGDIAAAFNPPSTTTQPDAIDVTQLVNKIKNITGAPPKVEAQLQPNLPELNADINALDIVAVVDAVKQFAYAFSGPCPCPSQAACGALACAAPGTCTGSALPGLGAGAQCVKTCSGGDNGGDPCVSNLHCPDGTCGSGFCRDRCGRCTP